MVKCDRYSRCNNNAEITMDVYLYLYRQQYNLKWCRYCYDEYIKFLHSPGCKVEPMKILTLKYI